jgi:hypothetical protein
MALDSRRRETGQLGAGQLGVRFAELFGRRHPARAHDEGDVVTVDAGQLSQPLRGPVGVGVRV